MNLAVYRARKFDKDQYVKGLCIPTEQGYFIFENESEHIEVNCHNDLFDDGAIDGEITINSTSYEIDPTTLKISFDNGKTWKTFEEVRIALGDK